MSVQILHPWCDEVYHVMLTTVYLNIRRHFGRPECDSGQALSSQQHEAYTGH